MVVFAVIVVTNHFIATKLHHMDKNGQVPRAGCLQYGVGTSLLLWAGMASAGLLDTT